MRIQLFLYTSLFLFFSVTASAQTSRIWLRHFDRHTVSPRLSFNTDYAYVNYFDKHQKRFQIRTKAVTPLFNSKSLTVGVGGGFWKDWKQPVESIRDQFEWVNEIRLNQDLTGKHPLGLSGLKVSYRLRFEERYFWRSDASNDTGARVRYLAGFNYELPWFNFQKGKKVFVMVANEIFSGKVFNRQEHTGFETNRFSFGTGYVIGAHWQIDFTYILEDNLKYSYRLYENVYQFVVRSRF